MALATTTAGSVAVRLAAFVSLLAARPTALRVIEPLELVELDLANGEVELGLAFLAFDGLGNFGVLAFLGDAWCVEVVVLGGESVESGGKFENVFTMLPSFGR